MLCIEGGGEVLSQEGTIQGDPLAMPWYSVNTSILINSLRMGSPTLGQVWFTDGLLVREELKRCMTGTNIRLA